MQNLKVFGIIENSADHGEMPHNAVFHFGLYCMPK